MERFNEIKLIGRGNYGTAHLVEVRLLRDKRLVVTFGSDRLLSVVNHIFDTWRQEYAAAQQQMAPCVLV